MQAEISAAASGDHAIDHVLDPDELDDAKTTYLTFDLDGQTFAVAVRRVREILDSQPITRLPNAPHDLHGVIDIRGQSVPIVDLASRLGMVGGMEGPDTRVVVFEIDDAAGPRPVGILAERVRDVCRIEEDAIEDVPTSGSQGFDGDLILGLCRQEDALVVIIDLARVFHGAVEFG